MDTAAAPPEDTPTWRAAAPAVVVSRLRVVRGRRVVLHDVSLSVARARIIGLLGASGSGKTTLLRSIVGSQVIAAGEIQVLGTPAGSASLRSRVGYVTQALSVYDDLSVSENLSYFARVLGVARLRVSEAIETVHLAEHASRLVRELSDGQRARVSLASALLGEPELLVLDEPTAGLDPVLRRNLWASFAAMAAGGVTLIVSSHVMDEAAHALPLTYAFDALERVSRGEGFGSKLAIDIVVIVGVTLVALALGATTLQRRTP